MMRSLSKFLDLLVPANQDLINQPECWRDRMKHRAIAFQVGCTSVLSLLSGTFAISTFTPSLVVAIPLGVLWAVTITAIDRYMIISSDSKEGNILRSLIARGAIGVCTSVVISEPTNLYIFRDEIRAEIALMQREAVKALESENSGTLERLLKEQDETEQEIARLEAARSRQVTAALAEAEGTAGSGLAGKGNLYREKSAEADRTTTLIEEERLALSTIENNIQAERTRQTEEIKAIEKISPNSLLTQIHALEQLKKRDPTINGAATFIGLFFLVLDFAPVLAKLSAQKGVYESLVEAQEITAVRKHQLAARLAAEAQDTDLDEHRKTFERVRKEYHQTVLEQALNLLQDATTTDRFKDIQANALEQALEAFRHDLSDVMQDAIKRATPSTQTVEQELTSTIPFTVRSEAAKHTLDSLNSSLTPSPPDPAPTVPEAESLFSDFLSFTDDDTDDDPWKNSSNGSVASVTSNS